MWYKEHESAVQAVADVLGLSSDHYLSEDRNRRDAQAVLRELTRLGWVSPSFVALVVEAAGGRVQVSDQALMDSRDLQLLRTTDVATSGATLRARRIVTPEELPLSTA